MLFPYKSRIFKAVKFFLKNSYSTPRNKSIAPTDTTPKTNNEWSKRDTLVGVLRNAEQLDIVLKHKFYHIPAKYISDSDPPPKYIAIYQSKTLFKNKAGIYYYGEVDSYSCIKRRSIREINKNSDEYYYRYNIKEWKLLNNPIEAKELGFIRMYTNFEMMLHSTEIPQLFMKNKELHQMYCDIKNAILYIQKNPESDHQILCYNNDNSIVVELDDLIIFKNTKPIINFSVYDFLDLPNTIMTQIYKYMKQ